MTKKILLTLVLFTSSWSSIKAAKAASVSQVRTQRGDMSVMGSGGMGYATGGIGFIGSADITGLYYLIADLSLGVETSLSYISGLSSLRAYVGPALQYNFWKFDRLTTYAKVSYLVDVNKPLKHPILRSDFGMDILVAKNFSMGPYLRVTHQFGSEFYGITTNFGGRAALHF